MANPKNSPRLVVDRAPGDYGPFLLVEVKATEKFGYPHNENGHLYLSRPSKEPLYVHVTSVGQIYISATETNWSGGGNPPISWTELGRSDWKLTYLSAEAWEHWDEGWPTADTRKGRAGECPRLTGTNTEEEDIT